MSWYDDLEHDVARREGDLSKVVDYSGKIYTAIAKTIGEPTESSLIHGVDVAGSEFAFLVVDDEERSFLVQFDPPANTAVSYLGSLSGGSYQEVFQGGEERRLEGTFDHDRLGGSSKLHVVFDPLPDSERVVMRPGTRRAVERSERLRDLFRHWATEPEHQKPK